MYATSIKTSFDVIENKENGVLITMMMVVMVLMMLVMIMKMVTYIYGVLDVGDAGTEDGGDDFVDNILSVVVPQGGWPSSSERQRKAIVAIVFSSNACCVAGECVYVQCILPFRL